MRAQKRSFALLVLVAVGLGCGETRINGPNAIFGRAFGGGGSTDVALSALDLSAGTLNPLFDPNTTLYTVDVPNNTASIRVVPTVRAGLSVLVSGAAVASGSTSADIPLSVGTNNIPVVVRDVDGRSRSYTVSVRRSA
jgi:Cadherin-like beta sandwich domain